MKTAGARYGRVTLLLLISLFSVYAGNNLKVVRSAANLLEIQLTNSESVAGVQFSLRTSADLTLGNLDRGSRISQSDWMVASYKPNDSTINVVIMNMHQQSLGNGQGALATVTFGSALPFETSHALLAEVMVANANADSLGVAISNLEWSSKTSIASTDESSDAYTLAQNYPNPFNPSTRIAYRLNKSAQVHLSVYDVTGREVNRLVDQFQSPGNYNVEWNTSTVAGQALASGMYFARLNVDNAITTRRMVLAK